MDASAKAFALGCAHSRYWARRQFSRGELWVIGARGLAKRRLKRNGRRYRRAFQAVKRVARALLPSISVVFDALATCECCEEKRSVTCYEWGSEKWRLCDDCVEPMYDGWREREESYP